MSEAPRKTFWWLAGRSGRPEYWLWAAILFALSIGLSFIPGFDSSNVAMGVVMMFIQVRRLHDFGRSGWWAVAVFIVPTVLMLLLLAVVSLDTAFYVAVGLTLFGTIWIGAVRGDPGENRFGPPAPFTWKRALTGR